ncbi:MAG: hypothetical protein KAH06_09875, partial [Desulfobacterales bacterium]|nr:hypothetical protein [Desulfobacterales bacterium]
MFQTSINTFFRVLSEVSVLYLKRSTTLPTKKAPEQFRGLRNFLDDNQEHFKFLKNNIHCLNLCQVILLNYPCLKAIFSNIMTRPVP